MRMIFTLLAGAALAIASGSAQASAPLQASCKLNSVGHKIQRVVYITFDNVHLTYSAQIQLDYSRIRSPLDGRAGTRLIDAGNMVKATDTGGIVIINQLDPIFVSFPLPADSLPLIRNSTAQGDVKVTAQDSYGKDLAVGKLAVIDNQINPNTATINFKAIFDNATHVLWPGQFVDVRVEIDVRRNVVAVPLTVVQQGPDGPFAFVVGPDRIVEKRAIKVGVMNKTTAVIEDGLQEGERVVTDGQYRIQAGSLVEALADPAETRNRGEQPGRP